MKSEQLQGFSDPFLNLDTASIFSWYFFLGLLPLDFQLESQSQHLSLIQHPSYLGPERSDAEGVIE
jgi:hypothetical protein